MHKMLLIASLMAISGSVLGVSLVDRDRSATAAKQPIDDHAITTTIVAACATAFAGTATQMQVETHQGVVELSGFVDNEAAADQAMEIAVRTPGVLRVEGAFIFFPVHDTGVSEGSQQPGLSI